MNYEEEEKKKKELGDNNLKRSVRSDVAVYEQNENPSFGVYKRNAARTIVPRDSEVDQSLGSQDKMAGEPEQYMAHGGFVADDDPELMTGLTPGTSAPMMPNIPSARNIPPAPALPIQQPVASPPPAQAPIKLPGMPPNVTPDELAGYLNTQKQNLNKFGPDQQMELQNQLASDRNSFGSRLTSGAKGFADALMMGVARAGNPGWQQAYEAEQNQADQQQLDTLKSAREGNLKNIEAGMSLDKMDPKSPVSKAAQETFGPLLTEKLGIRSDNVSRLSAADMQNVLESSLKYADIEGQNALKQATLELQSMIGNANIANQKAQRDQAANAAKTDAASKLMALGKENATVGPVAIPFTRKNTGATDAATKVLLEQMQGGGSSEGNSAPTKEGPYGPTTTKDGVEYEWSPITGKYHRK